MSGSRAVRILLRPKITSVKNLKFRLRLYDVLRIFRGNKAFANLRISNLKISKFAQCSDFCNKSNGIFVPGVGFFI